MEHLHRAEEGLRGFDPLEVGEVLQCAHHAVRNPEMVAAQRDGPHSLLTEAVDAVEDLSPAGLCLPPRVWW